MSLDPVLASIAQSAAGAPGPLDGAVTDARERLRQAVTAHPDETSRTWVGQIHDRQVTFGGRETTVRLYPSVTGSPSCLVVFVHGGGYALSSAELSDDICCRLARLLDAYVVAVDYKLAPEYPWPASYLDTVAATGWAVTQAHPLAGADVPVVLVGESAGANIAAAVSQTVVGLTAQVLVVPGPDFESLATVTDVEGSMLTARDVQRILEIAFDGDDGMARDFPASAVRGSHLAGSPPTLVALAGFDPTAEVGRSYASSLARVGVQVELLDFPDMFHPFLGFAHVSPGAAAAVESICERAIFLLDR